MSQIQGGHLPILLKDEVNRRAGEALVKHIVFSTFDHGTKVGAGVEYADGKRNGFTVDRDQGFEVLVPQIIDWYLAQ